MALQKLAKEWDKMAKILDCKLDEIYEPEDGVYIINGDHAQGNFGNNGTFNGKDDFVFDTMKKYILKLEEEYLQLKEENTQLKEALNKKTI